MTLGDGGGVPVLPWHFLCKLLLVTVVGECDWYYLSTRLKA